MESNIKHIIENFEYFELDKAQKELISEWASNSEAFYALKHTFIAANALPEEEVNPTIKQRLDVRFADKYNNERLVWYNKLWLFLWPKDVRFYKRPLVQFASICLIAVLTIPFFPNLEKQQLAKNETSKKDIVQKGKSEGKQETEKVESEIIEEAKSVDTDKKELPNEVSISDRVEKSGQNAEKRVGWELNNSEQEEDAENEEVAIGFADQTQKKSESLDDLEESTQQTQQDFDANYFGAANSEMPAKETLSSDMRLKDDTARNKVEVEQTLDLLTALY